MQRRELNERKKKEEEREEERIKKKDREIFVSFGPYLIDLRAERKFLFLPSLLHLLFSSLDVLRKKERKEDSKKEKTEKR